MDEQDYRKVGWQLDKDLISFGNKIYCPEKCLFIPVSINKAIATNKSNSSVGIKVKRNKYLVSINIYGKNTYFGSYDSLEDAKAVYKENKLKYIYELAKKENLPNFIVNLFEPYFNNLQNQ
ncbi:MAG: hypothetical protein ACI4OP_02070 [Candidatus Coprovivens sp.]